jgi:hypothetical protein
VDTNRQCSTNRKGGETSVDQGKDGKTNFTLRVKEQALNLSELMMMTTTTMMMMMNIFLAL